MPSYDFRAPRLFVDAALVAGASVRLDRGQSNYLGNVMRLAAGDPILVFNGRDGEWRASIGGRKRPENLTIAAQTRPQDRLPDLAFVFAPLKHARLDYMVQKAVEMGASSLRPVLTRFTQVARLNVERMRANVIEAAEQCGILSLAEVVEPIALDRYLSQRDSRRLLVFCDEAVMPVNPLATLQGAPAASGIERQRGQHVALSAGDSRRKGRQPSKDVRNGRKCGEVAGPHRRRRPRLHGQHLLVPQGTMIFDPEFDKHGDSPRVPYNIQFIGAFTQEVCGKNVKIAIPTGKQRLLGRLSVLWAAADSCPGGLGNRGHVRCYGQMIPAQ